MSKNERHFLVLVYASGVVSYHETSSPHMATKQTEKVQKAIQEGRRALMLELGSNDWESVVFLSRLDQVTEVLKVGVDSLQELKEHVGVMSDLSSSLATSDNHLQARQEVSADE